MLEFFEMYGPSILACVVAAAGAVTSLTSLIKSLRSEKRMNISKEQMQEDIKITQQGIVEAFKKSKIGSEWKVSVSNQIDKKLEAWSTQFIAILNEHEELRTKLAVANTQILAYTAAFNKLSEEEKKKIQDLVSEITENDTTIEV